MSCLTEGPGKHCVREITVHVTVGQHANMGFYQPLLAFSRSCASGQRKSHDFSLIFPIFYSLLSILKATLRFKETNSLRAISFQNVIGVLEKKKKRQQSFLQGRPHSSSVMCCKPRLGTQAYPIMCLGIPLALETHLSSGNKFYCLIMLCVNKHSLIFISAMALLWFPSHLE